MREIVDLPANRNRLHLRRSGRQKPRDHKVPEVRIAEGGAPRS
jgi:hypothetical protein